MHRLLCLGALALSLVAPAVAADYPVHPVRTIVSYPPGGTTDLLARLTTAWLQEKLGQPFVVENKPGGENNIGVESVVKSAPDGYTMFLVHSANRINAPLYKNLPFNCIRDTPPVARIMRVPNGM